MNELDKKKKLVLLLLALFGTVGAAIYGCSTASELAYSWLKIGHESKLTSIFSLISAVNDATSAKAKAAIFGATAIGAVIAIAPLVFIGIVIWGLKPKEELYGSARFATDLEIKKSGFCIKPDLK